MSANQIVCPVCGEACTHFEATTWEFAGKHRHGRPLATCPNGHHVLPLEDAIALGVVGPGKSVQPDEEGER